MSHLTYTDGIRSLSSIYTPSFLREVINHSDLTKLQRKKTKYQRIVLGNDKALRLYEFLELLYKEMFKNYRNEYLFKNAIVNKLLIGKYSLNTTVLLNEFKLGKTVADTILVNGEVRLFEIKTNLDNLNRLDHQLKEYKKVVEKIFIVTDTKNLTFIKEKYANSKFGIIEFTNANTLRQHQNAVEDKSNFEHAALFKLLRQTEYIKVIADYFGYKLNIPNTKIFKESFKLVRKIDVNEFQRIVFNEIRARNVTGHQLILDQRVPPELRLLCYVLDLKKEQYSKLFNLLNKRI